jgi:hypothetical protein
MVPVSVVKIIPEAKYPFKIEEVRAQKGKDIRFELKPLKDQEHPGYELIVENLKKTKGRYSDAIILKTDSKIKPEIKIHVYGDILDKIRQKKKTDLKKAPRSPLTQPGVLITPKEKSKQATPTTVASPPVKGASDTDAPAKATTPEKDVKPAAVQPKKDSDTDAPAKATTPEKDVKPAAVQPEESSDTTAPVKTATPSPTATE